MCHISGLMKVTRVKLPRPKFCRLCRGLLAFPKVHGMQPGLDISFSKQGSIRRRGIDV